MIRGRRLLVSILVFGLTGCTATGPLTPSARFGLERLGSETAAPVLTPPAQASAAPLGERPLPPSVGAPVRPPASAGSGGGSSRPSRIEGLVLDAAGNPVAGAVISAEGLEAVSSETGAFLLPLAGSPLLTVSAPGFTAQTAGAPYRFVLTPLAPPPAGSAFTLTGLTDPPVADAFVSYVDASGTYTSGRTAADGTFSLTVEPAGPLDAAAAVVVHTGLTMPARERGVLQAASPRMGAVSLPGAPEAPVRVVVATSTGEATLAPELPAGLAAEEAVLSLTSDRGVSVPLVGSEGSWPARVPTFTLPGFSPVVALSAVSPAEDGRSVVERTGLAAGGRWAPRLLELPEAGEAARPGKRLKWKKPGKRVGLALFAPGQSNPAWKTDADAQLPSLAPGAEGYELELKSWDEEKDSERRYATRRVPVEAPPVEEPTASEVIEADL